MDATSTSRFAPLKNVAALLQLVNALRDRDADLPGLGVFHGPSGYGKTKAMIYVANKSGAAIVSVGDSWTRKKFLEHVLRELGEPKPRGTVADLAEQAINLLSLDGKTLMIDEADRAVDKGWMELIRELHDSSLAPIVLIGEEKLPQKLMQIERVHNRVLDWLPAEPCDLDDARKLARVYAPSLTLADDLVTHVQVACGGVARRICTTLNEMLAWSRIHGVTVIDRATYGGRVFTGEPTRRLRRVA
jgi:DNA transposition AAA+ family ATPase